MPYLILEFDQHFRDYNFSSLRNPAFPEQVNAADLVGMLKLAAADSRIGVFEVADVFHTSLRNGTYEGFQRAHGPKPIDYRDWCLAKVGQFLGLLGCGADPEAILGKRPVEGLLHFPWAELVRAALMPEIEAEAAREAILQSWGGENPAPPAPARGWGKNGERDNILVAMRDRGQSTEAILREFDKRAIEGIPAMKERDIVRWVAAYQDADLMVRIDQALDKAYKRRQRVKA